jgi:hypothetical protein
MGSSLLWALFSSGVLFSAENVAVHAGLCTCAERRNSSGSSSRRALLYVLIGLLNALCCCPYARTWPYATHPQVQ